MSAILDMFANYESEEKDCFNLSLTERLIGLLVTATLGIFSGFLSIFAIALLRVRKFCILFAIFNLMTLFSTAFIVGFKRQLNSLTERKRIYAAIGMIVGMLITFIFAFKFKILTGIIFGFLIELVSFIYYILSYVPMGTALFHKCFW